METVPTSIRRMLLVITALGVSSPLLAQQDELAGAAQTGKYAEAFQQVEEEARQGVPQAQYSLGRMYAFGQGVEKNMVTAVKWYRKAADQGLAEAQYHLGEAYGAGEGVPQDYVQAYQWMARARQNGEEKAKAAMQSYKELMTEDQLQQAQQGGESSAASTSQP
ncbi:tetratricopeptide repeat protein [Modicisalibacter xianhensis]|uniref:Sel1 repeat-containing protein n=1 Tax=Modicisalibacter xianhensis TaxID=442341 RepID=A0A1I2ZN39_9GAMM|nr:tetratricopeptide repeat protein [Halomonas xianhensis]SFH39247.1 Sel1 repeat-containing protein [Halomonas xianhensis]